MPGKLYQGEGEVVTPHLGDTQIHAMYLGSQYVGYDSRYSTFISASGGTIFDSGSYRYHLFTSSSIFTINSVPLSQLNSRIEILTVGGGGGGAPGGSVGSVGAGNGGAVVHIPDSANYRLNVGTYNISIGAGGIAGVDSTPDVLPTSGSHSFISGSGVEITALGGASPASSFVSQSSLSGVSGQYGHNFDGGNDTDRGVGGGGGAGEPGDNALSIGCNTGGVGGDGYLVETFPFSYTYDVGESSNWGGGGGGESFPNMSGCASPPVFIGKQGGAGGGGSAGDNVIEPTKKNGYPNTGGGGGANIGFTAAGAGGSGFVGFKYRIS
jgi:hypothetical protein